MEDFWFRLIWLRVLRNIGHVLCRLLIRFVASVVDSFCVFCCTFCDWLCVIEDSHSC